MGQSEEKRSTGKRKDEGKKIKRPAAKPEGMIILEKEN